MEDEELDSEPRRTETMVRYIGRSDVRSLSQRDLSGNPDDPHTEILTWNGHGAELPWANWVEIAGSPERAREIFNVNVGDFLLVAADGEEEAPEVEEFSIGGQVPAE